MKFQNLKRIMCCLMAALILCCAVVRPIEASATAVLPAAAAISGVSADLAVAGILAALGYGMANTQLPYVDFVQDIAESIPAELISIASYNNVGAVPVVKYDDITYLARPLVDFVVEAIYTRAVFDTPVSEKRYELTGDPGTALNSALDWYYNETSYYPGHLDKEYCAIVPYMIGSSERWSAYFSDEPIEVTDPDADGNYNITVNGKCEVLSTTSSGAWQYSGYNPGSYPHTNSRTWTGTWTGNWRATAGNFAISALFSNALSIIGNTARDLTDDEDYQAYLERQKFFVIDPDGDGDDDGNNEDPQQQPYLPIRLLEYMLNLGNQTQEEAQSGAAGDNQPSYVEIPNVTIDPQPVIDADPTPDVDPDPDPVTDGSAAVSPEVGPNDTGSDIPNWLQLIYKALVNIMLNIIVQIEQLNNLPARIGEAIELAYGNIQIWIYEQTAVIDAAIQWVGDKLTGIKEELVLLPPKIEIFFNTLGSRIETAFQWIWDHLATAFETLGSIITTSFEWIWQHLATAFQNVIDTLNTFWQNLKNWMQTMADYLLNGLKTLFIPEKGYMDAKIAEMRGKFGIVDSALNTFDGVRSFFFSLGSKPPVIYIDLSAAIGSYYFGGETIFVDMRWYADYKPTMDLVLSAILWLWFVWRFMIALPGIIQGFSGYTPQNNGQTETGMVLASQWYER